MPNTDIEELSVNDIDKVIGKNELTDVQCVKLIKFIQQRVVEAQDRSRAEAYEDIRSTMLYHFAYSGRKTIKYCDIDKIAPSAINPITNEIYPNFRTQP